MKMLPFPAITNSDKMRMLMRVSGGHPNGCWLWHGCKMSNGYGVTSFRKRKYAAHRAMYTAFVGPIPEGLDLDHLCRVRDCVNPAHLEPVTRKENLRRSELTVTGKNHRKTTCKYGHSLHDAWTYVYKGNIKRQCRICRPSPFYAGVS